MKPEKHIPMIAALLMLTIGICRGARCYKKGNVDHSCAIKDLNNSTIDCPRHCKRKKAHDVQILLCADEDEDVGDRIETDKQKETHFKIHVCENDLCNECAKIDKEKNGVDVGLIAGVGGAVVFVLIACVVGFVVYKRKHQRNAHTHSTIPTSPT